MEITALFDTLWKQYCKDTPMVKKIHDLFLEKEKQVQNDHIAFRTFNLPSINITALAEVFLQHGYTPGGTYDFPQKKLLAQHFEHSNPSYPKIFISELITEKFSPYLQNIAKEIISKIPNTLLNDKITLLSSGTAWEPLSYVTYNRLLEESEYAAWLYAFGFRANHFTINVNTLKHFDGIAAINTFLKKHKVALNTAGGEIKGSPEELLEQSSTLAFPMSVQFSEGQYEIPLAYYEFAYRHPQPDGRLYTGFVATSADKIFESTDVIR